MTIPMNSQTQTKTSTDGDNMTNQIELTPQIANILKKVPKKSRDEILKRAWDACCDGALLTQDFDPWDGNHEDERKQVELDFVTEVIELNDFDSAEETCR